MFYVFSHGCLSQFMHFIVEVEFSCCVFFLYNSTKILFIVEVRGPRLLSKRLSAWSGYIRVAKFSIMHNQRTFELYTFRKVCLCIHLNSSQELSKLISNRPDLSKLARKNQKFFRKINEVFPLNLLLCATVWSPQLLEYNK